MIAAAAYVYIISNKSRRLYIGATTDLVRRVREHKEKLYPSAFTARYNFTRLVYFETLASFEDALERERYLKGLLRAKNIAMIQEKNPHWLDLSANWSARLLLT